MRKNKLSLAIVAGIASLSATTAFSQESNANGVDEVIVQGFRASLEKAADKKRNAESIQDSIVAEDLGKMPDQNVAESLQRITGVSISRSGGEGSKISIRGFGSQFNVVKMNDRTLATTGVDRSFDFSVLPSELIAGADVIKSPTASLSSGSIGGYVNLHSARPLDNPGFHAAGTVNARYQNINAEVNPEVSGLISNTFADDTLGALLSVSYRDVDNRIDSYSGANWGEYGGHYNSGSTGYGFPINKSVVTDETGKPTTLEGSRGPGRLRYVTNIENRKRLGANLTLQWAPNENITSTFDALYSKLDLTSEGSGIQVASQEDWYTAASVNSRTGTLRTATQSNHLEYLINANDSTADTQAYGYNLAYTEDKLTLKGDLSYSKSESKGVGDASTALAIYPVAGATTNAVTMDFTHGDIPYLTTSGYDLTDPSTIRLHWQDLSGTDSKDEVKEAKFDAKYEIDVSVVKSLEAGASYSNRELLSRGYGVHFNPAGAWPGSAMYFDDGTLPGDTSIFHKTAGNFMKGVGGVFPRQWLAPSSAKAYRDMTQDWIEAHSTESIWGQPRTVALSSPNGRWDYLYPDPANISSEETTEAVYLQANVGGDISDYAWTGNVGGRYVKTDNDSTGFNTTIGELTLLGVNPIRNTATQSYAESTVSSSDNYFLPSANFSLDLNNGNYIRFGSAKTITRPSLRDSSATFTQAPGLAGPEVSITGSNPLLKPYEVKSLDLSYEHYSEGGNAFSIGYFYKDITSFISSVTTYGVWDGPVSKDLRDAYAATGVNQIKSVTTGPQNRKGGTVNGVEVGVLHTFDNLPGIWSGLGVQANYTYATSKDKDAVAINLPGIVEPDSAIEGFAKNSYNLVGFYDKDGIELRLGYNYNGKFMNSRSGDGISPAYTDAYGQLDFSASYEINESLTTTLAVNNLTNETRVDYLGQRDRVNYVELTGIRYQIGLRAKF